MTRSNHDPSRDDRDRRRRERTQSQGQAPTAEGAPLVTEEGVNEATADLVEDSPEASGNHPSPTESGERG